jgi:uncharacterized protein (TIGR04255 family)
VVVGVQFSTPRSYQQIFAGEVWGLFRKDYTVVQEQPPLQPSFETFGLKHQRPMFPQISFASGASHDRFWFLRPDGDELIQFQNDRFLHNWRKVGDGTNVYPRFEAMAGRFENELRLLQDYFNGLEAQELIINQCEISYINHIPLRGLAPQDWLRFVNFDDTAPDDFSVSFREVVKDEDDKPMGRLICDATTAFLPTGEEIVAFTLTVKGAPSASTIDSALSFLRKSRGIIVNRFSELSTDSAHKNWERLK